MVDLNKKRVNSWDLFNEMFKKRMDVIIITDEDEYDWGKIKSIRDDGITLQRINKSVKEYKWTEVVFVCEDGFPVRKLPPSRSDNYIEQLQTKGLHDTIRKALAFAKCGECETPVENSKVNPYFVTCPNHAPRYSYRGGHPFEIESVQSQLFNAGNADHRFWNNHPLEEVLLMRSKEGKIGQLWEVNAIFEFGRY